MLSFHIVIPARLASERLPGKVLTDLNGKTMLQRVYEVALSTGAENVVIAADHEEVAKVAEGFGAKVCMTAVDHRSGTERISEVVTALDLEPDEIVIGLQADEPLMPPQVVTHLAQQMADHETVKVASLCHPIRSVDELLDPNVVKVVMNRRGYAIYFTRAAVPWNRDHFPLQPDSDIDLSSCYFRHIGLYGYRADFFGPFQDWNSPVLEQVEKLEQLRILWHGGRIFMSVIKQRIPAGVDSQADVERIVALLKKQGAKSSSVA